MAEIAKSINEYLMLKDNMVKKLEGIFHTIRSLCFEEKINELNEFRNPDSLKSRIVKFYQNTLQQ